MDSAAIILAAGAGTRMRSKHSKVVHKILGKPLVGYVVDAAREAGIDTVVSVVGHNSDEVRSVLDDAVHIAHQEQMLGTADAVKSGMTADCMKDFQGAVVILYGDCPLITSDTIRLLMETKDTTGADCVLLSMRLEDPFGYGRVIREDSFEAEDASGEVLRIVEQKDATECEAKICECNSGIYCFDASALRGALEEISPNNAQGEYYITDAIEILKRKNMKCIALEIADATECLGVNSRAQLAEATAVMRSRINAAWMDAGVTMMAPELVWIGPDAVLESDVEILPNVMIMGTTSIGEDSVIGPDTRLTDTVVGRGCTIDETVAIEALIEDGATCGPRAYLRPGAHLCKGAKAGTHVEIKKSVVGVGSKVPHLSYVGDTTIGEGVNLGAGTITCNYDGTHKHKTTIGDRTFVGSDTMLVAPVNLGSDVVVGAGSVITKDIPDGALAVARARERIIDDWSRRKKIASQE